LFAVHPKPDGKRGNRIEEKPSFLHEGIVGQKRISDSFALRSKMTSDIIILELYRKVYLIRRAEQAIIDNYDDNEMKTPMHMSTGEEAVAAGVCSALGSEGQSFSSYRCHGVYLATSGDTDKFFAELYGKETGVAKGKAGSMHLSAVGSGFLGSSAIVASTLPVAVGAAFANKQQQNNKTVAVFFGDGAIDEGNFWESLNLACLLKLPILFVLEDNGYAVHTSGVHRHGYRLISNIVSQFNCTVFEDDTTDAERIYIMTCDAIKAIRQKQRPSFLCLKYYRYLEHVGVHEDFSSGYRTRDELSEWLKRDPVDVLRRKLLDRGIREGEIQELETEVRDQVYRSLKLAQEAPFPGQRELYKGIFA
jgi:TPP-dependent pyruvate/acetoin dehydrogenase alpha subunit